MHCTLLQAGELQAIVGDDSRDGRGGKQYCGLWSLTSKHRLFNAFGNSYAGLIPTELRKKSPTLQRIDDTAAVLRRDADEAYPVSATARYQLRPPNTIDHTLSFTDHKDVRAEGCDFREVQWCSYMNCPDDTRLHLRSNNQWLSYISPRHGVAANIAPAYVPDEQLESWPIQSDWSKGYLGDRPFHWDRAEPRFDEPFYFGRLGDMVLIHLFDRPEWLRFYCSPTGGGDSLIPGQACPAWDFEWVIPASQYHVGHEYNFRTRVIYKPFISNEDVRDEYTRTREEWGNEAASV